MPKVTAASVNDLTLDDDDLPIKRVPMPSRTTSRPQPSIDTFALDDSSGDLPTGPGLGLIHDRYRRLLAMGTGPLGTLHRGRDEAAKRDIMIEEVSRDVTLSAPANALGALTHPNLVKFYGHVIDGAAAYLITEIVEGKSLRQQLAERGAFASLEAIGIIDQVCAGLAAAHERNVFHRGVRPDCIVMAGRTAKLMGFAWGPSARSSPYTAPELVGGGPADARADLYSVGVTLAELLTGSVPVPGKLEFPSDVPRALASLVRKLLSREPTIRPASVKAVRDAFSAVF
jgi:serine/threonine-protein kinase